MQSYKGVGRISFDKVFDDVRKTLTDTETRQRQVRRDELLEKEYESRRNDREERRGLLIEEKRIKAEEREDGADIRKLQKTELEATLLYRSGKAENIKRAKEMAPGVVAVFERNKNLNSVDETLKRNALELSNLAVKAGHDKVAMKKLQVKTAAMFENLNDRKKKLLSVMRVALPYEEKILPDNTTINKADYWEKSPDIEGFLRDTDNKLKGLKEIPDSLREYLNIFRAEYDSFKKSQQDIRIKLSGVEAPKNIELLPFGGQQTEDGKVRTSKMLASIDTLIKDKSNLGDRFRIRADRMGKALGISGDKFLQYAKNYEGGAPNPFRKRPGDAAVFRTLVMELRGYMDSLGESADRDREDIITRNIPNLPTAKPIKDFMIFKHILKEVL